MKKTLLVLVLALVGGCQSSSLGLPCTVDADCEYGQSCFLDGFPGGFCTRGCTRAGDTTECPSRSLCSPTSKNDGTLFCTLACNSDSDCRGGSYACAAVGTSLKACRP
jgi:hypothetical protein